MMVLQSESSQNIPAWETSESLHSIIGAAPVAIVAVDRSGKILYINQKLEELFGYTNAELINNEVEMLMPQQFHSLHRQHRQGYVENPHTRAMDSGMDLVGQRKDGSEFPLEAGLSTVQFGEDQVVIASIIDITVRKQTEDMLEQRVAERTAELERRRRVADALRDVLAVVNQDHSLDETLDYIVRQAGMLLEADGCAIYQVDSSQTIATIQSSYGLSEESIAEGRVLLTEGDITEEDIIARSMREKRPQTMPNLSDSVVKMSADLVSGYEVLRREGIHSLIALPLYVQGEIYGALVLYYKTSQDFSLEAIDLCVTFSDQAGLVIENAQLRFQAEEVAVAEERSRIARDLHDSVTQTLFSATIIADVLPRLWDRNPEQGRGRLQELHQLNRGALAEMRTMLLELRPTMLDNADLAEVLEHLVDATSNRARIPVILKIEGETELLPNEVRIALYRVAQEALNNVFKHANASEAAVELRIAASRAELIVNDNGTGFMPEEMAGNHEGLRIMRERADEIDASLTIASEPGKGTQITVLWHNT